MQQISAKPKKDTCLISLGGIGISTATVKQTGWQIRDKIEVAYIPEATCLLFSVPSDSPSAYTLAYANAKKQVGGKIWCQAFIRNHLQALVQLPKRVPAIVLSNGNWRLALLPGTIPWQYTSFNAAGLQQIPTATLGVYELLDRESSLLRVGEGILRDRIKAHLSMPKYFLPMTKTVRFIKLTDKEDAQVLEKVLLARYEAATGTLPPLNLIRA